MEWLEKELTREDLIDLFTAMNEHLQFKRLKLEIVVYGGSAFALHGLRNSSADIDVEIIGGELNLEVQQIINKVGRDYDLNKDWFNDQVSIMLPEKIKKSKKINYISLSNLKVKVPVLEELLAMKVIAGRDKDNKDIELLLNRLGIHEKDKIVKIVENYFDREYELINKQENNRISRNIDSILNF